MLKWLKKPLYFEINLQRHHETTFNVLENKAYSNNVSI